MAGPRLPPIKRRKPQKRVKEEKGSSCVGKNQQVSIPKPEVVK